jgi:Glycosyltransferase family 87
MGWIKNIQKQLESGSSLVTWIWFGLATIAALLLFLRGPETLNNFYIYKGVFWHSIHKENLYLPYPSEYTDVNHYGPAFSLFIMPFAILPVYMGSFLWAIANSFVLYYSITRLSLSQLQKNTILLIACMEMIGNLQNQQFNPMLAGMILLAFTLIEEKKDFWAAALIMGALFVKVYGIIGLVFIFFSREPRQFIQGCLFWFGFFLLAPMVYSNPSFVLHSYSDWFYNLQNKNIRNMDFAASGGLQDISLMGLIRRISGMDIPNVYFLVPGAIIAILPLLMKHEYSRYNFRLLYVSLLLIMLVLFSSSSESPTYIIAVTGVALWFVLQPFPKSSIVIGLLIFMIILTSISPTDIFPRYLRSHYIIPYALKSLPVICIWLHCLWFIFKEGSYPNKIYYA